MNMMPSPTDHATQPASAFAQKICPRCKLPFDDGGFAAKVYCSVRCRNGMKNVRAVARDRQGQRVGAAIASVHASPSAPVRLVNATIEQLDEHELKLHSGALVTQVCVAGIIPVWAPKIADTIWSMAYSEAGEPEWIMLTARIRDAGQKIS